MDKSERNKFGTHGLFDVLLGLHGYKYEDWTYEVYVFPYKRDQTYPRFGVYGGGHAVAAP